MFRLNDDYEDLRPIGSLEDLYLFCDVCRERITDAGNAKVFFYSDAITKLDISAHDISPGVVYVHQDCASALQRMLWLIGINERPMDFTVFIISVLHHSGFVSHDFCDRWSRMVARAQRPPYTPPELRDLLGNNDQNC